MKKKFKNTGKNKQLRSFLTIFSVLGLVESAAVVAIVYILLPDPAVFWGVVAFILLLLLAVVAPSFAALFFSSHKIKSNILYLNLGRRYRGRVPIKNIIDVKPYGEDVPKPDFLGLVNKRRNSTFYCLGGGSRYILSLKEPQLVRAKALDSRNNKGYVDSICLDVDNLHEFEREFFGVMLESFSQFEAETAPPAEKRIIEPVVPL